MMNINVKQCVLLAGGLLLVFSGPAAGQQQVSPTKEAVPEPFSVIVLPDTQIYSHDRPEWLDSSRKEIGVRQTTWIAQNATKHNIKFVLHMGDIVHLQDKPYQWVNANKAMSILDGVVPYCFAIGNHDLVNGPQEGSGIVRDSRNFNNTFGYKRYENEPSYGGRMSDDGFLPKDNYDNSYHFFNAGGHEFMVIALEVAPTDKMLDWANEVVRSHPDKRTMVITHSYLEGDGTRVTHDPYVPPGEGNLGESIWNRFVKKHKNIFFVFCGHHNNSFDPKGFLASRGDHGNTVYQLVSGVESEGWLRILRFAPAQKKILVKTYSPWLDKYNSHEFHQFELPFDAAPRAGTTGTGQARD